MTRSTHFWVRAGTLCAVIALGACDDSVRLAHGRKQNLPEQAPLRATSVVPQPGLQEVGPRTSLRIQFSEALDSSSLGPTPITVTDLRRSTPVKGETTLEEHGFVLLFRATDGLEGDTAYRVDVSPGLRSAAGGALDLAPEVGDPVFPTFYTTFSIPPVIGAAIEAAAESSSSILVTWSAGSDNATAMADLVYGVWLARAEEAIDYDADPLTVSSPGATSSLLVGLSPGTRYRVAVRAEDAEGNLSDPTSEEEVETLSSTDSQPPNFSGITGLRTISPSILEATWGAAEDPGGSPPEKIFYRAYVFLGSAPDFDHLPTPSTSDPGVTSLLLEGLKPGTEYAVVVRAVDAEGNEDRNAVGATAVTFLAYEPNIRELLTVPEATDCWIDCTRPEPGGCARGGGRFCHSSERRAGGLNLSTYAGIISGRAGRQPPLITPGDPDRSYIFWRTDRSNPNFRGPLMPSGAACPLPEPCLETLKLWVRQGALEK